MRKKYERHYKDTAPPVGGLQREGSQLTPLARSSNKVSLNCDQCGLPFERYACWAKRTSKHFCSRACASENKIVRFPIPCSVCGAEMLLKLSHISKVVTCSRECLRKKRVTTNRNMRTSPEYTAIAKKLLEVGVCACCKTTSGPWSVFGVKTWIEDGLSRADGAEAKLYCRHCHLKAASHKGIEVQRLTESLSGMRIQPETLGLNHGSEKRKN